LVLAGQVTLDETTLADAGIAAAFSITDHAGSVQLAIEGRGQPAGRVGPGERGDLGMNREYGLNKVPLMMWTQWSTRRACTGEM
jgi:hypothetical protein